MPVTTCPDPADLERLFLGGLAVSDAEALEQHVLECNACLGRLEHLFRAKETLAVVLCEKTCEESLVVDPVVADLIKKVESLRPAHGQFPQGEPMLTITCSSCQKKLSVMENAVGEKVKCPGCGQVTDVPAALGVGVAVDEGTRALPSVPNLELSAPADVGAAPTHPPSEKPDATIGITQDSQHDASLTDFLAAPQSADELGRLGEYRILKILGHGGMGVVYQAEDPKLERSVAIKAMLPTLAVSAAGKRFCGEARVMAKVEHDHIVRIYQVAEDRGVPFLAMEFLKGESLDERLKRNEQLPLEDLLRIGREIAEGLSAAHAIGLIHRDIKPANIWLEARGEGRGASSSSLAPHVAPLGPRVKILDFGLARAASQEAGITQEGAIMGTPAYMAPEQGRGENVDARCDLFSLGVVLYRMCTGQQPFVGRDSVSTLVAIAMTEPVAPIQINKALPPELSELVMKLLEKDPVKRIGSAAEVVQAVRAIEKKLARQEMDDDQTAAVRAGEPSPVRGRLTPPSTGPLRGSARRKPLVIAAALFLLALAIGGAATLGVIRFSTPDGDFVVTTDDPDFKFSVSKGAVLLEDTKTGRTYKVKAVRKASGEYELDVTDVGADLSFKVKTFTIKRGEQFALTATFEPKQIAAVVAPPLAPPTWSMVRKFEHADKVRGVAISRDGKYAVTGSMDGAAILWDAASGNKMRTFPGFAKPNATFVDVSDDGKIVASGQHGGIDVWDAVNNKKLQHFDRPAGKTNININWLALSRDGKRILIGSGDGKAVLWEVATRKQIEAFEGQSSEVGIVALSDDGTRALTRSWTSGAESKENTAVLWDAASRKKIKTFLFEAGGSGLALSGDGKLALGGSENNQAILWDPATGKQLHILKGHTAGITNGVALSGDGKVALTASYDKTAILWDTASGKPLQTLKGHTNWILAAALSRDGKYALTGSDDNTAILWAVNATPVWSLDFDEKGRVNLPALALNVDEPLTVEAWVTPRLQTSDKSAVFRVGWIHQTISGSRKWNIWLPQSNPKHKDPWRFFGSDQEFSPGKRTHLAAVWSGKEIHLYVNGQMQPDHDAVMVRKEGNSRFVLGDMFQGHIDQFRVSKAVRYQGGTVPINERFENDDKTLILYRFDEGQGDVLKDSSGNGHDGKIVGAKWVKADEAPTPLPPGNRDLALRFDGNSRVDLPEIPKLTIRSFTLEAWVYPDAELGKMDATIVEVQPAAALLAKLPTRIWLFKSIHSAKWPIATGPTRPVHLAAVSTPGPGISRELLLFVDGKLVDRKIPTGGVAKGKRVQEIGANWRGLIREVRISKVARYGKDFTPQQRFEPDADTLALYHFDEGAGDVLKDSSGNSHHGTIVGAKWVKADGSPIASFPPLDPAWLAKVAGLPGKEQVEEVKAELIKRNPGFDGEISSFKIDEGVVTSLAFSADHVKDLSPVQALTQLRALDCGSAKRGPGRLADLSPLAGMKLQHLGIPNTAVSDLSPLRDMKLESLRCHDTNVSDLTPLQDMNLENLGLNGTKVSDLSPLKNMKLTGIYLLGTNVSDLSPLKGMPLATLWCEGTKVTDLSLLRYMPLKDVRCSFNRWRDAEILRPISTMERINYKPAEDFWAEVDAQQAAFDAWAKRVAALPAKEQIEEVKAELMKRNPGFDGKIHDHKIDSDVVTELRLATDKVTDVSPVRVLTGLQLFHYYGSGAGKGQLSDLWPLKDMKMSKLYVGNTKLSDLSPLKGMALKTLACNGTLVSDLSPLKGMIALTTLECTYTSVSDLSPLKGMRLTSLYCRGTKVTDLTLLKGMPLTALQCDFNAERDAEIVRSIRTLETINGQPKEAFWKEWDAKKIGK